jgi:hypothetical protein
MNMSVTEQQKAYHLRKLRTRCHRMDLNRDGYLSREDFELMAKRLVGNASGITKEKTEETRHSSTMRCPLSVVSEQNFVKTVACCMKCLGQKLPQ